MKKASLFAVGMLLSQGNLFAAPLVCEGSDWKLVTTASRENATLKFEGEDVQFGKLVCSSESAEKLRCRSENVADAGFSVYVAKDEDGVLKAALSEVSFFGSKKVADLECSDATASVSIPVAAFASAPSKSPVSASKKIAKAVDGMEPLALSGVKEFKIKKGSSVKEALVQIHFELSDIDTPEDLILSDNAWEPDSGEWGVATMKEAYSYIFDEKSVQSDWENGNMTDDEFREFKKNLKPAKEAFKLLLGTGVEFGVAPIGAVQCGGQYAALVILDLKGGKAYSFAREGSGC